MKFRIATAVFLSAASFLFFRTENGQIKNISPIIIAEQAEISEKSPAFFPQKNRAYFLNCDVSGSKSALVGFFGQEGNVFEFNQKNRWSIASLTKLMTSVVALEKMGANEKIEINEEAILTEGASGGLKVGEIYKVSDLIKAMMTISANDAANAVADSIGRNQFVKLMNEKAEELAMEDTIFFNPSGLSFLNQSTVSDLEKLVRYILKNHREIFEISVREENSISELKSEKARILKNINKFAGTDGFFGGKSGYLESSGRNLISLFNKNGKIILIAVLGAQDAYRETENLLKCAKDI